MQKNVASRLFSKRLCILLKEVYPGLRYSDYAVKYEVRTYTDINEIKRLIKTQPQKLSLNEMYLLHRYETGEEGIMKHLVSPYVCSLDDEVANLNTKCRNG